MNTIKTKTAKFWQLFMKQQQELETALTNQDKAKTGELVRILNDELLSLAGCYLEVEGGEDNFYECTLLSGEDKTAQILAVYIKKFAPDQVLDRWIINDCRPPLSEKGFTMRFDVRQLSYGVEDLKVSIDVLEEAKMVDLHIYCPGFEWQEENERRALSEIYLEMMLGSLLMEGYVNSYECVEAMDTEREWVLMSDLYEQLSELVETKGWVQFKDPTQIYRAYKLDKEEINDQINHDKILITTCHPELFTEIMNNQRTVLDQFNRLGGEYGTLAVDHDGYTEEVVHQKKVLERELNDLLYSLGIARCIGSAVGTHHYYLDVAVFDRNDFKTALAKINQQLGFTLTYLPY